MEVEQQKIIENFLLMDDFVKSIDIVFSFVANPETSIEREYTTLLTDKLGSIMNETVLQEYKDSVIMTKQNYEKNFREINLIDTTDKTQDDVGKEVTQETLKSLKELLIEKIGYLKRNNRLVEVLKNGGIIEYSAVRPQIGELLFDARDDVEAREDYLQPIPIAVITNKERDKVLLIKKNSSAVSAKSAEKNKSLIYVGGHTRFEDTNGKKSADFLSICRSTLKREVKEEIGISIALNNVTPFLVYSDDADRSRKHVGICFVVEQDLSELKLSLDSTELVQKRGRSKSGTFQKIEDVIKEDLESWSRKIIKYCFRKDIPNSLISIFDWEEYNEK